MCFFFSGFTYEIADVHFCFVVMKFADIVAVIIEDKKKKDCFLMMMISWLFKVLVFMQCSASLLPLPLPLRRRLSEAELRLSCAARAKHSYSKKSR